MTFSIQKLLPFQPLRNNAHKLFSIKEFLRMNKKYENLAFYGTILVLKVMVMSLLTARQRRKNGALRSAEDAKLLSNHNPDAR